MIFSNILKWSGVGIGVLIGIANLGVLGHLSKPDTRQVIPPAINIPEGPYSSYRVQATRDGYEIEYRANDPLVLSSERSINVDNERRGVFGGGSQHRTEYRTDQYTMEGDRNISRGENTDEGKSAQEIECIVADAGSRSQGAMAGSAIATGLLVPSVMNIPYVGWLAAGWATLLGQDIGSDIGSEVGSIFNDC